MEGLTTNPEQQAQKPEIIHRDDYDIVISPGGEIDIEALVCSLDKIDDSLVIDENLTDDEKEEIITDETGKRYVFESGEQKYFIKQKWYDVRQHERIWGHRDIPQDSTYGSILNELNITPNVISVLESKRVKDKIARLGYEGVKLVPMVAGAVRKDTGLKFLVYDYVEMDEFQDNEIENLLEESLIACNIDPKDLSYNMARDKNNPRLLYLLDIEGYKKFK